MMLKVIKPMANMETCAAAAYPCTGYTGTMEAPSVFGAGPRYTHCIPDTIQRSQKKI